MKDTHYATAVARIRMNENYLMSADDVNRLIGAKSKADAVSIIADSGLCKRSGDDIDFKRELSDMWELILSVAPEKHEFDFLLLDNDFHNLKTALKAVIANEDADNLYLTPSVVPVADIENAVKTQKFGVLPDYMSKPLKKAYDLITENGDGQLCDAVLDSAFATAILKLTKTSNTFVKGLADLMCDSIIMRTAVRCAKMKKDEEFMKIAIAPSNTLNKNSLIQSAQKGVDAVKDYLLKTDYSKIAKALDVSLSEFERECENMLSDYCESAKLTAFGPAPICAYIIKKSAQIKTARIVLTCKSAQMSEEDIRRRI